jgi:hypothetical protein
MAAYMRFPLEDVSGYDSLTLSFYYWAVTGTINLNDRFDVRYWSGSSWNELFVQDDPDPKTWLRVEVEVPLSAEYISFVFYSDAIVGMGPYEGVYIDDVQLTGVDTTDPVSQVGEVPSLARTSTLHLPVVASDAGGSGVDHYLIKYKLNGTASVSTYRPSENPSGHWTNASVPFDVLQLAGEGTYEIYSQAVDGAGMTEDAPSSPDTIVTFDLTPPHTNCNMTGTEGWDGNYSSAVTVALDSNDALSGLDSIRCCVDGGAWQEYVAALTLQTEGHHEVSYYALDLAGNRESTTTIEIDLDLSEPDLAITTHSLNPENGTMLLDWTCSDAGSGLHHFELSVDDEGARYYGASSRHGRLLNLPEGSHTVRLRAFDAAGNAVEETVPYEIEAAEQGDGEGDGEEQAFPSWAILLLGAVAAAGIVGAALLLRGRRKG